MRCALCSVQRVGWRWASRGVTCDGAWHRSGAAPRGDRNQESHQSIIHSPINPPIHPSSNQPIKRRTSSSPSCVDIQMASSTESVSRANESGS